VIGRLRKSATLLPGKAPKLLETSIEIMVVFDDA